jgi:hypothetical protein
LGLLDEMARKSKADHWSIKLARPIQIINGPMLATRADAMGHQPMWRKGNLSFIITLSGELK